MGKHVPSVSIIIVNYNGFNYLRSCLDSIAKLSYPKKKLEVIVVDNGSKDGSTVFLKKLFPWAKVIALKTNEGFTGGNNTGIKNATGEYIVLLNNDTTVDKNWLKELCKAADNTSVGIVTSKIYLATPYIKLSIKSSLVQQSDLDGSIDFSPRGILLEDVHVETQQDADSGIWYKTGFENKRVIKGITIRWTNGDAEILLPLHHEKNTFTFIFHGYPVEKDISYKLNAFLGKRKLVSKVVHPHSVESWTFDIDRTKVRKELMYLVQNAGNIVLSNGFSKDRGSVLRIAKRDYMEFYEEDSSFYRYPKKLVAACGAAMLIKRKVIDQIEGLDGYYFMYYEDIDFSLRAWKMGWNIRYAPRAKVYHHHRASSGKGESGFFITMVEKNHLFVVFTHLKWSTCIREYFAFLGRLGMSVVKQFVFKFTRWSVYGMWRERAAGRLEAFKIFHRLLPSLLMKRIIWKQKSKRDYKQLEPLLY